MDAADEPSAPHAAPPSLGATGLGALVGVAAIATLPTLGTLGNPSSLLASPLFALLGVRIGLRQLPRGGRVPGVTLAQLAGRALVSLLALV